MLYQRMLILAKVETVVGTDAAPVPATDAMIVRDATIAIDVTQQERPIYLPDLSNAALRPGRKTVTVTFTAEVKGSGAQGEAPKIGTLLRGAGFAETALALDAGFEYDPISSNFESLTIYMYIDGLLHKVTGARGSFNLNAPAGEVALVNFTFQGNYVAPTDAAFPAGAVYEDTLPPIVELAALSVNTLSACAQAFTVDVANTINPRLCVNAAEGVSGYNVTARSVTGSFNPEATLMATNNPFAALTAGTIGDFTATIGQEDNNQCVITGKTQYTGVTPGNRDGTLIWDIPIRFVRTDGDDEIKFAFPQTA